MKGYSSVEAYLKDRTPAQQAEYERIKKIVLKIVPDTEMTISYGMPTFKYKGKYLLYFGTFANHMSVFPGSALTENLMNKLTGYKLGKGTIQFTEDKPLPDEIIEELVRTRYEAINNK